MEELVKILVTDKGFFNAFWELLAQYRKENREITQREVYEKLNEMYFKEFGEDRFPSFDAFRKKRDRKRYK